MNMKTELGRRLQLLVLLTVTVTVIIYENLNERNVAVLGILVCYFLWNVWTMHQLSKSRADAAAKQERNTALIRCVTELSANKDVDQAINKLLVIVTEYFHADRTYIFELDQEQNVVNNTYEFAAEGVSKEIDNLQNVPVEIIQTWFDMFYERGTFFISDLEKEKGQEDERAYEVLKAQNINSLIAVPFKKNGVVTGFLGVDNPRLNYRDLELLASIQFFIMNRMDVRNRQEQLQYLSYRDMLTNLYNRNYYIHQMEKWRGKNLKNIGVVYIDLNGLKQINDIKGHEEGDSFIRQAAQQIVAVFPEHTYRIGGDEFLVICPDILEQQFEFLMSQLKMNTRQHHLSISCGVVWKSECEDLDALIQEADEKMYEDKKKFYEKAEHNRRRNPRRDEQVS